MRRPGRRSAGWAAVALAGLLPLYGCGEPQGFVTFSSTSCSCVRGRIQVKVDDVSQGTLDCGTSRTIPVLPGVHTLFAEDQTGTWGPQSADVGDGETYTFSLIC